VPAGGRQLGVARMRRIICALSGAAVMSVEAVHAASCAPPPIGVWRGLYDAAQKPLPMRYEIQTTTDGKRILLAKGAFNTNEPISLQNALAGAGRIDEVWLYSGGGSSAAGMGFGRILRKRGLAVRIPADAVCFSACSMAFLGGALRSIDHSGYYGVHMWSAWSDPKYSEEFIDKIFAYMNGAKDRAAATAFVRGQIQQVEIENADYARQRANYLIEMSVSLRLMHPNTNTASDSEYWICPAEARSFNVVNVY